MHQELSLWGERMPITASEVVHVGKRGFPLYHVQASDESRALLMLCMIRAKEDQENLTLYLLEKLRGQGLEPRLRGGNGNFLESVEPLQQKLTDLFGEQNIGIVILVNGEEPGEGRHALDEMRVEQGDVVQVIYRIAHAASDSSREHVRKSIVVPSETDFSTP